VEIVDIHRHDSYPGKYCGTLKAAVQSPAVFPLKPPGYNAGMSTMEKSLQGLLSRYCEFRLAILFGSQATDSSRADSDVDLALLADTQISSSLKLDLIEAIGAEFGRPVDIVDLYDAAEPILGQVLKGKRLLGDNQTYARLLTKHLINVADFVPLQQRILAERRAAWIN
jgi:predicted nucleotidyltransferase